MTFMKDKEIADLLGLSPSWVRGQRWRRRKGMDHCLTVDPVMIGSNPRYLRSDIGAWIAALNREGNHAVSD